MSLYIGTALTAAIKTWQAVRAIPWIWNLIVHHQEIKRIIEDTVLIFHSARHNRGIPTCDDTKRIMANVALIFEKKIVDFPNLDEIQFAQMIKDIDSNIVCAIKEAQPKRGNLP